MSILKNKKQADYTIIVGCGRLGANLANTLSEDVFAVSCAVDRAAEHVVFVKKRFKYICAEIYRRNFDVRFQKFVYVLLLCLGGIFLAEQIVIKFEIVNRRD